MAIRTLRDFIKRRTYARADSTSYLDPLRDFVEHYGRIDIATLNYDTVVEEFANRHAIPVSDGFGMEWSPQILAEARSGVRLFKLHGSVTWYETQDGRYVKDPVVAQTSQVNLVAAGSAESLMFYPERKWAYSEPMVGALLEFKRLVESSHTKVLVVIGYSFRDNHIRGFIRDALRNNGSLEVVLIDPSARENLNSHVFSGRPGSWRPDLRRRVLVLPYKVQDVLPELKNRYVKRLRSAATMHAAARRTEAMGGTPQWRPIVEEYAGCEHHGRMQEVAPHLILDSTDRIWWFVCAIQSVISSIACAAPDDKKTLLDDAERLISENVADRLVADLAADGGHYVQSQALPRGSLHPALIKADVLGNFIRGQYDTAVLLAYRAVEIAVREASGSEDTDLGVGLMREAFHPKDGSLKWRGDPGESQGLSDLMAGATAFFKNPQSHRVVGIADAGEAAELVLFASYLLRVVDRVDPRPRDPDVLARVQI